jgi:hypothetical protein
MMELVAPTSCSARWEAADDCCVLGGFLSNPVSVVYWSSVEGNLTGRILLCSQILCSVLPSREF